MGFDPGKVFTSMKLLPAAVLDAALQGDALSDEQVRLLAAYHDLPLLLASAARIRDGAHHNRISYSRKVFIPLTQLCRDVCHYCTFAQPPRPGQRAYLTREEVLAIAR